MLVTVAKALGNTPAMARKAYIHPRLIAMAKDGNFIPGRGGRATRYLSRAERGLIALLETAAITAPEINATDIGLTLNRRASSYRELSGS